MGLVRRLALAFVLAFAVCPAQAAKVKVLWTNPSTYTTGAPIPVGGLAYETIYWGTCIISGTNPAGFGTQKGTMRVNGTVPGGAMYAWVFPSGVGPFCFVMTSTASGGGTSAPSNVAEWTPPPTLGKPTDLGAVIHLHFKKATS